MKCLHSPPPLPFIELIFHFLLMLLFASRPNLPYFYFYNAPPDTSAHNPPIVCTAHLALISQLWYYSLTGLFAFYIKIQFGLFSIPGRWWWIHLFFAWRTGGCATSFPTGTVVCGGFFHWLVFICLAWIQLQLRGNIMPSPRCVISQSV
jgi:hypothetical protein